MKPRLYNDLDTECLQPSEAILDRYLPPAGEQSQQAFFGRMGDNPDFEHSIPNAWMAATPGHPLYLVHTEAIDRKVREGKAAGLLPESLTGPVALREAIVNYEIGRVRHGLAVDEKVETVRKHSPFADAEHRDHRVVLLPSEVVYPYSWGADGESTRDVCWVLKDGFDPDKCKKRLEVERKKSVSITYWSHTHSPDGANAENMKHIE